MSVLQRSNMIRANDKKLAWPAVSIVLLGFIGTFVSPILASFLMAYLFLLAFITVITQRSNWSPRVILVIGVFLLMIVIGLTHAIGNTTYNIFKDVWYFGYAGAVIVVGYLFGSLLGNRNQIYSAFLVLGVITAAIHLIPFFVSPTLITEPGLQIRAVAGTGYYAVCIAIVLGLYRLRDASRIGRVFILLAMTLCAISMVLSFSRTMYIVFTILMLSFFGWLDVLRHASVRWGAAVLLIGMTALVQLSPPSYLPAKPTFMEKTLHSLQEIRIKDYSSFEDINTNWRGFETARAIESYATGRPDEWLLGRGFGHLVDLGFYMNLSHREDEATRYIPILHNGYAYLLVKTGLVGLLAYLVFLWWLIKIGSREAALPSREFISEGRLIAALAVIVLLTTSLISGLFNLSDFVPLEILLGALLGLTDRHVWRKRVGS